MLARMYFSRKAYTYQFEDQLKTLTAGAGPNLHLNWCVNTGIYFRLVRNIVGYNNVVSVLKLNILICEVYA